MSRLFLWLLRTLGSHWNITPAVADFLSAALRFGGREHIPTQLVGIGSRLWARGFLNREFFDTHADWVLPYWAVLQLDPTNPAFVSRGLQPVFLNTTHRDWTTVGNLGSTREAIVDPRGLVTPQPLGDGWSLDAWVKVGDELFIPSRLAPSRIEQKLYESLPLVQTSYEPGGLFVVQEVFGIQDSQQADWVVAAISVENRRNEPRSASVYLSVRPFNPEGVSLIKKIEFKGQQDQVRSIWINGTLGGIIPAADAIGCLSSESGDIAFHLADLAGQPISTEGEAATAVAAYDLDLAPHTGRTITGILPMSQTRELNAEARSWTRPEMLPQIKRETTNHWRETLGQGMRIRVPDDQLQQVFDANKAYLLLLHDGDSITPGPFTYHDFWFRDAAFMLNALDQLGYHQHVRQVLVAYPRRLQKDGYMLAEEGEWDANGQALWSLVQNARLSGDLELLADQYWKLLNAAHWIDAKRQQTKAGGPTALHYGLFPEGPSAEHLGPSNYFYWDDFWGLAGLACAEYAARVMGKQEDARKLNLAFRAFEADLNASLEKGSAQNGANWIPVSPYRRADSAMIANLVALYPLQLMSADDKRIAATIDEIKQIAWQEDAFFHNIGHAGFGTYLSLDVAGCHLYQRCAEAWPIINWVLKHASSTYTWAEALSPLTRRGGMGDGHHGWAAAAWISIVRNALLFEEGNHLVLTPALPSDWTYETMSLQTEGAATWFGDVNFTIAFGERAATLMLKGDWREPPDYIEWNLPFTLKNAGGDRPGVELVDNRIRIPSDIRKVVATW